MKSSVDKQTDAAARQAELAEPGRALMGRTRAMRAAGETYLPKFEGESDKAYKARLNSAFLFNGYRKTVKDMTGRVFDKPVTADGVDEGWLEDVDLAGRDLSVFACEVFETALAGCGLTYILADAPRSEGTVTQAQAQAGNLRPYLVHIQPDSVLGWKTAKVGGATVLSQFRFMEKAEDESAEDEFAEAWVDQIRVLDLVQGGVRVRLYRKDEGRDWQPVAEEEGGDFVIDGLSEIPVTPVYLSRAAFFEGEPVLADLADVNIAHWQSQSDQRVILHIARCPVLFGAGLDDEDKIVVSAGTMIKTSNEAAKLDYVEHSGAAIEAGREDLKDLEFMMEAYGLQLLVAQAGKQSATGETLDAQKETSALAMMADGLKDALERSLAHMQAFTSSADASVEVTVNKDFGAGIMTAQELGLMLNAVNSSNLSRDTFLREMARRGMIAPDTDPDLEAQRIDGEPPRLNAPPLDLGADG